MIPSLFKNNRFLEYIEYNRMPVDQSGAVDGDFLNN